MLFSTLLQIPAAHHHLRAGHTEVFSDFWRCWLWRRVAVVEAIRYCCYCCLSYYYSYHHHPHKHTTIDLSQMMVYLNKFLGRRHLRLSSRWSCLGDHRYSPRGPLGTPLLLHRSEFFVSLLQRDHQGCQCRWHLLPLRHPLQCWGHHNSQIHH